MTFRLAKPPSPSHESPADPTDSEAESGCRAPRLSVAAAAAAGTVTVTVATIMSLSRAAGGPVTVAAAAADHRRAGTGPGAPTDSDRDAGPGPELCRLVITVTAVGSADRDNHWQPTATDSESAGRCTQWLASPGLRD